MMTRVRILILFVTLIKQNNLQKTLTLLLYNPQIRHLLRHLHLLIENEIKFHLGQASQSIIEVGKRLLQAKSLVKHGEWQTWLENNFKLSYRTAKNFMDCAERFENMQSVQI